ncbi:MAG: carbohydrate ABC transporter permease [Ruminococcaceae bacterium]|nr:carbohydrate ABC transporter permease [Oscillospiraceae bacterium]
MHIKKSKSRIAFEIFNTLFMLFLIVITAYPVLYVVFASFSDAGALTRLGGDMLYKPIGFTISAYEKAFANPNILSGYMNTLFVVVVGVTLSMLFSIVAAYCLSRKNAAFIRPANILIMFTMWFNGGLIPMYIAVRDIGLVGSLWSLIIPGLINTYNMIILRTAFYSVPDSLVESARIDGAGHIRILFSIMLPLIKASVAVVALYYGVSYWNSWFNASIYLQGQSQKWPLQLILRQIIIMNDTDSMMQGVGAGDKEQIGESIKYAVIVIATAPILCVYPFIQKYFVKGVMIGAVKG